MALKVGELYATLELKDNNFTKILENINSSFSKMANSAEKSLDDVVDSFQDAEDAVDKFSDTVGDIPPVKVPEPDTSKFSKTLDDLVNKTEKVGTKMSTKLTLPLVGVATTSTVTGAKFEQAMANVQAITSATSEDFASLEQKAKEMGASTKFSASQSADAMSYLGMAGWNTNQILAGIEPVLNLAIASGSELATVADIVSDALTGFGMSAEDTARFTDILAQVSRKANTNVEILGESFKYSSALMGSMGYSAEDTAIALGLMANAGVKGSSAGTALSGALARLIDPTKEVKDLMDKYNISLTDSDGNMNSLGEIMNTLRDRMSGLDTATKNQVATQLFGQEAMKGMLAIVNASDEAYDGLTDAIYGSEGASKEMADVMGDTLQGRIDSMKSAIEGGLINAFDQLQPYVEKAVAKITELATWFANLDGDTVSLALKIGALVASIGPMLVIFAKTVTIVKGAYDAFMLAKKGILLAKSTVAGWNLVANAGAIATGLLSGAMAVLTSPITLVIAIIAGLIAIGVALWQNWDVICEKAGQMGEWIRQKWEELSAKCQEVFGAIGEFLLGVWDSIKQKAVEIWDGICGAVSTAWDTICNVVTVGIMLIKEIFGLALDILLIPFNLIWQNCKDVVIQAWEAISSWLSDTWNKIVEVCKAVFTPIIDFYVGVWSKIFDTARDVWEAIKTWLQNLWNSIKDCAVGIWTALSGWMSSMWESIKTTCSRVWESIKTAISEKWNQIKESTMQIWENIKTSIASKWESLKTSATEKFNKVKSTITGVWDSIWTSTKERWDNMVNKVKSTWETIKSTISNGISKLKDMFKFDWSLPKIKLPHFKISGKFSLNPPSVPSFGLEWYKRGGLFDSPTVVGLGEAGREGIVPFSGMSNKSLANELAQLFADAGGLGGSGGNITVESMTVREEADITRIAQELYRLQQRAKRGKR